MHPPTPNIPRADLEVSRNQNVWKISRSDFWAEWDTQSRRGLVRQSPNPYSIDTVLRILHSLVLTEEGGFLVHAASAIRNGRAFLFSGVSGAGKTTISRLAPPDVTVLTDEISYVRKCGGFTGPSEPRLPENSRGSGKTYRRRLLLCSFLARDPRTAANRPERREPRGRCCETYCSLPRIRPWSRRYFNRRATLCAVSLSADWCSGPIPRSGRR